MAPNIKNKRGMNGIELRVDTNVLINLVECKGDLLDKLNGNRLFVSVITEIKLLGWYKITDAHKKLFVSLLRECKIVDFSTEIKSIAIAIKQSQRVKLPDAIIAATSVYLGIPLMTFDADFQKIKDLNLLLLEE